MALVIKTTDPSGLLKAIKQEIDDKKIQTWEYDKDGDFTHSPPQWNKKAWLHPQIKTDELNFSLLVPQGQSLTKVISGVYQGRFVEMLVTHFDAKFTIAKAEIP